MGVYFPEQPVEHFRVGEYATAAVFLCYTREWATEVPVNVPVAMLMKGFCQQDDLAGVGADELRNDRHHVFSTGYDVFKL